MLIEFLGRHDLDVPAAEFAGEPHVLAAATYSQGELIFWHQNDGPADHVTEQHLFYRGRLQCIGDQDLRVIVPADNVNPFTVQFIDDILYPVSADTYTSSHTVNSCVTAADSYLAPMTWFTGEAIDGDNSINDLRDFLFEEPLDKPWT